MLNLVNGEEKVASLNSVIGIWIVFSASALHSRVHQKVLLCLLNYSVIKPLQSNCEASHILLNVSWLRDIWRTACLFICCFKGSKNFHILRLPINFETVWNQTTCAFCLYIFCFKLSSFHGVSVLQHKNK